MPSSPASQIRTDLRPLDDGGRRAQVIIDRPDKLNVLNSDLIGALRDTFTQLSEDEELRAVVLTGAGERAFIGGADITEMSSLTRTSAPVFIEHLHAACAAIRQCPVPVIARIQGYCLGGGREVAAACDLRVAADDAVFAMPEVRVGIPSVIEAALLPRLIGIGHTRELVLTGDAIDADRAEQWGLVERTVPRAELDDMVERWVHSIAAGGRRAIRLQKLLARQWEGLALDHAVKAGVRSFASAFDTDEPARMMQAFVDRKRAR